MESDFDNNSNHLHNCNWLAAKELKLLTHNMGMYLITGFPYSSNLAKVPKPLTLHPDDICTILGSRASGLQPTRKQKGSNGNPKRGTPRV